MEENEMLDGLIRRLGVANVGRNNSHKKYRGKFCFLLKKEDAGPVLSIVDPNTMTSVSPDLHKVSGPVAALARTLESVGSCSISSSSIWSEFESSGGVSLYENPFLCYQMRGVDNIIDEKGNPIEVSNDETSLFLRISRSPIKPGQFFSSLRIYTHAIENDSSGNRDTASDNHIGGMCKEPDDECIDSTLVSADAMMLSDTSMLMGNRVYFFPSVGGGFKEIFNFSSFVPSDSLTLFLSLFLSYTRNIPIEGEDLRVVKSPVEEEARPTIILEKVDPEMSLYMSMAPVINGIDPQAMSRLNLSKIARLSSDEKRITIYDLDYPDMDEDIDRVAKMIQGAAPGREAKRMIYHDGNFFILPEAVAAPFLFRNLPLLLRDYNIIGTDKLKKFKVTAANPKLSVSLSSGIDFLEGEADVEIGEERFTLADLIAQFNKNRYVQLSDGTRAVVDNEYMRKLERIFRKRDKDGKIKVSFFDLPEVESLLNNAVEGEGVKHCREVYEGFNVLPDSKLPAINVNAKLRDYQKEGVKWLNYLYKNNLGGCLADDMGLGKTLQTISLLSLTVSESDLPSLVVVPKSLIFNWQQELQKFAPEIDATIFYGSDRDLGKALEHKLVITTYAIVRNDIEKLKECEFDLVILDESQNIKNVNALSTKAVYLLNARHRLALSGTPLENNLTELYSLFRFLNPTMFGSLDEFNRLYTYPIQKYADQDVIESLRRKIFPFILRRLKRDVLKELPDRTDQVLLVEMSPEQRSLYERRRKQYRDEINDTISRKGVEGAQFVMFQALTELRQIASVPEVIDAKVAAPKLEMAAEHIMQAVENGHKTVVFFNFLAGIEKLGEVLDKAEIDYETMTGATRDRKRVVERFQKDPKCMVLLLTLKVGGVGINLTAADTVFIMEPWWNKAAEEQAVNRLHRIGQRKAVNAYKFITRGTIEEKILQLQQQKQELFDGLIGSDSAFSKNLSEEDIKFILG